MIMLGRHPLRTPDYLDQTVKISIFDQPRNELVRRTAIANNQYVLVCEINRVIPIRAVENPPRK